MVALFDQRILQDIVSGNTALTNSGSLFVTRTGIGQNYPGSGVTRYATRPQYMITGPISIVMMMEVQAFTGYGPLISTQLTGTTNIPFELRLDDNLGAIDGICLVRGGANYGQSSGTAGFMPANYSGPLVVTYPTGLTGSSSAATYILGKQQQLSNVAGPGFTVAHADTEVWIAQRSPGGTQLNGRVLYAALFNRELTSGEALEIVANPWRLFEPKPIWVPVSAAGGLPTLSNARGIDVTTTSFRPAVDYTY